MSQFNVCVGSNLHITVPGITDGMSRRLGIFIARVISHSMLMHGTVSCGSAFSAVALSPLEKRDRQSLGHSQGILH